MASPTRRNASGEGLSPCSITRGGRAAGLEAEATTAGLVGSETPTRICSRVLPND